MKTKITLLAVTFAFFCINTSNAQTPSYLWAKSFGAVGYEDMKGVITDANENVLITGVFYSPTINIGSFTLTNATNAYSMYVAKLDKNGTALWAKSATGNNALIPYSIAVDNSGNVIVAGRNDASQATFGSITLNNIGSADI